MHFMIFFNVFIPSLLFIFANNWYQNLSLIIFLTYFCKIKSCSLFAKIWQFFLLTPTLPNKSCLKEGEESSVNYGGGAKPRQKYFFTLSRGEEKDRSPLLVCVYIYIYTFLFIYLFMCVYFILNVECLLTVIFYSIYHKKKEKTIKGWLFLNLSNWC